MSTHRGRREWERLNAAYERSGETVAEFCQRRGLARLTFQWWRSRLAAETPAAAVVPEVRLVEIDVSRPPSPARSEPLVHVEVSGVTVTAPVGSDVTYLASLVAELRSRC